MRTLSMLLAFGLVVLGSAGARAVDGVIEINQRSAQVGNVTGIDEPGFPVTLVPGASYRLTSDLVISGGGATLIEDNINGTSGTIQLDLNGFSLRCQPGAQTPCVGPESGIHFDNVANVTIRNGGIYLMGSYGILVSTPGARIEAVHAINNGGALNLAGVRCGEGCLISDSVARANQIGFYTDGGSAVIDSVAATNQQAGIRVGAGSVVRGCSVYDNATQGVIAGNGAAILSNAIYSNGELGIDAIVGAEFGYGQNTLNDNNGGGANPQVDTSSTSLGGNMCQGDATCP